MFNSGSRLVARESHYLEDIYAQVKSAFEKNEFEKSEIESLLEMLNESLKKIHSRYPTLENVKSYFFLVLLENVKNYYFSASSKQPPTWEAIPEIIKKAQEMLSKVNIIFDNRHNYSKLRQAREKYTLEVIGHLESDHPIQGKLKEIEKIVFPSIAEIEKLAFSSYQDTVTITKRKFKSELRKIAKEHYIVRAKNIYDGLIEFNKTIQSTLETAPAAPQNSVIQSTTAQTTTETLLHTPQSSMMIQSTTAQTSIETTLNTPQNSMVFQYHSSSTRSTTPEDIAVPKSSNKVTTPSFT